MERGESHPHAIAKLRQMISFLGSYSWARRQLSITWPVELSALPSGGLACGSVTTHQLLSRLTAAATEWCSKMILDTDEWHIWILDFLPGVVVMCLAEAAAAAKRIRGCSTQEFFGIHITNWPADEHHSSAFSSLLGAAEVDACSLAVDLCTGQTALQSPARLFLERRLVSIMREKMNSRGYLQASGLHPRVFAGLLAAEARHGHAELTVDLVKFGCPHWIPGVVVGPRTGEALGVLSRHGLIRFQQDVELPDLAATVEELVEILHFLHRRKIGLELRMNIYPFNIDMAHRQRLGALAKRMQGRFQGALTVSWGLHIVINLEDPQEDIIVEATSFLKEVSNWHALHVKITIVFEGAVFDAAPLQLEPCASLVRSVLTALRHSAALRELSFYSLWPHRIDGLDGPMRDLIANNPSLRMVNTASHLDYYQWACEDNNLLPSQVNALKMVVQCSRREAAISRVAADFGGAAAFAFQVLRWLFGSGAEPQLQKICGLGQHWQGREADWGAGLNWEDGPPLLHVIPADCHHVHDCHHKEQHGNSEAASEEAVRTAHPSDGLAPAPQSAATESAEGESSEEKQAGSIGADAVAEEDEVQTVARAIYNDELLRALQESKSVVQPASAQCHEGAAYLDDRQLCLRLELSKRGGQADVIEILLTAPELDAARRRVEEAGCSLQPPFAGGSFCLFPIADLGQLLEAGPPPVQGKHYVYALQEDIPALKSAFMRLASRLRPTLREPPQSGQARGPSQQQDEELEPPEHEEEEELADPRAEESGQEQRLTTLVASWRRDMEEQGLEIIEDVFVGVRPRQEVDLAQRAVSSAPSDLQSMRCD